MRQVAEISQSCRIVHRTPVVPIEVSSHNSRLSTEQPDLGPWAGETQDPCIISALTSLDTGILQDHTLKGWKTP